MTFPVPSPYRGYSAIDWDTVSLKTAIDALNSLKSTVDSNTSAISGKLDNSHAGSDGHAGIYTPSANQYYVESVNGNGSSQVQSISNTTTTTLDLGTAATANGGGYNAGADTYTVPGGGVYVAHLVVRPVDGFGTSCNVGLQVHDSNTLGYHTGWFKYVAGGGGRCTVPYFRMASWGPGTVLRAYMYQDSGVAMRIDEIFFAIWRIG